VRAVALWGLLAVGCGGTAVVAPPSTAISAYSAAVSRGDAEAAYALLSDRARASVSRERFASLLAENRADVTDAVAQLAARDAAHPTSAEARLVLETGETVTLVLEGGAWRVRTGVLDAPTLATPTDAVLSLRRALQRRSLGGVLRVLSREQRAEVFAAIDALVSSTADPADLHAEVEGDHATVTLTGGLVVTLVRESGEWRVVDVE
jgi:hypothetical protein